MVMDEMEGFMMFRVMVVEDSKPIMRNIRFHLSKIDEAIEVVAFAFNGVEALEKMKQIDHLDILVTDIKMPMMDGITLIAEAKKRYPAIYCIIISGHNDFEYARNALKLQVSEYILKPVEFDELERAVQNVIGYAHQNAYLLIQQQLESLIVFKTHLPVFVKYKHYLRQYRLIVVRSGLIKAAHDVVDQALIKQYFKKETEARQLWLLGIGVANEVVLLIETTALGRLDVPGLLSLLRRKSQLINIIVSEEYHDVLLLNEQYTALSNCLSSKIIIGESQIFHEDIADKVNHSLGILNSEAFMLSKRFSAIVTQKQTTIRKEIAGCFATWKESRYPLFFIRRFLTVIIDSLITSQPHSGHIEMDINNVIDKLLQKCSDYQEVKAGFFAYLDELEAYSSKDRKSGELIDDIVSYIRQNVYGNITLSDISQRFLISPSYVSRLMKKRFHQPPMDYYVTLKIEEAKRLLETNEDILIKDVADSLGFADQHYFSKVFKAHVGVSPIDVRNKKEML